MTTATSQIASRLPAAVPAPRQPARIALLGCGGIGSALAEALLEHDAYCVSNVLVRNISSRTRSTSIKCFTESFEEVLSKRPDVVVECLGGIEPAATWCERLLESGISVVSANKLMIAASLSRLSRAAQRGNAQLRFDAAVCAGVPVLDSVGRLRSAGIKSIRGVVNGTTQWIIDAMSSNMSSNGASFDDALRDAIRLGYAEPDPSADLSGRDSADKLSLLTAAAGFGILPVSAIAASALTHGLERIEREDIRDFERWGALRIVASVTMEHASATLRASVQPTIVSRADALARARGTENVVEVSTVRAGCVTLRGLGAGAQPTLAALLADLEACLDGGRSWATNTHSDAVLDCNESTRDRWAIRITESESLTPAALVRLIENSHLRLDALHTNAQRALIAVEGTTHQRDTLLAALQASNARIRSARLDEHVKIVE